MYYKEVDYNNYKEMFEFLSKHFTYHTMNSWNGLTSIANNVKVWNLPVDASDALKALEEDEYLTINQDIHDWEYDHPGCEVYFNGRSGGYLVLKSKENNGHIFDNNYDDPSPCRYDDYDEWEQAVIDEWGSLEQFHDRLVYQVKLVQEFDTLCDDLVKELQFLISEMKRRESLTRKYAATLRFQRYYYDTLEDLKLHMLDMKKRGYSVYEFDKDELYAEYEMNESINSEVILDEEGDEDFVYETK